ncbi:hypothetical protein Q7P37_004695 [Cladosporium fusiforme]
MFPATSLFVALTAVAASLAAPSVEAPATLHKRQVSPGEGWHDDYFYSHWTDGGGSIQYYNQEGGGYTVDWQDTGNFVSGKGWNPGSNDRVITWTGEFNPQGNGYLCVYGWTRNPLIEYYVVEAFGTYNPGSQLELQGSFESDGSTYDFYTGTRVNQPSIDGDTTFTQYFSIRRDQRTSGTVTFGNHVQAWANAGMGLGNHYYQIMATEGYQSSGSSRIYIQ